MVCGLTSSTPHGSMRAPSQVQSSRRYQVQNRPISWQFTTNTVVKLLTLFWCGHVCCFSQIEWRNVSQASSSISALAGHQAQAGRGRPYPKPWHGYNGHAQRRGQRQDGGNGGHGGKGRDQQSCGSNPQKVKGKPRGKGWTGANGVSASNTIATSPTPRPHSRQRPLNPLPPRPNQHCPASTTHPRIHPATYHGGETRHRQPPSSTYGPPTHPYPPQNNSHPTSDADGQGGGCGNNAALLNRRTLGFVRI